MLNEFVIVTYNDTNYKVCKDKSGNIFVIDDDDIELPDKMIYMNKVLGYFYCYKNNSLHSVILNHVFCNDNYIDHINRIKSDNRKCNLRISTQSEQNKNQSKKKRNVMLPDNCNVKVEEIPTFIWYIHGENNKKGGHGDRWAVDIKHKYFWKTTSSKKISTKCKFELAKKHLRCLIESQPELFNGHCMNGELSNEGKRLENEYVNILKLAGYEYTNAKTMNTIDYLQENFDLLNDDEINIIKSCSFKIL